MAAGTTAAAVQDDEQASLGEAGGAGAGKDPNRQAPAAEIEGAQEGGTVKVISVAGLNTMDPTEAYYANTISILSNLVTRSLTQYVYDPESKDMVLIPDLATDLGTPNDDFTEWTFTIRDGRQVRERHRGHGRRRRLRHQAVVRPRDVPRGRGLQQRLLPRRRHLPGPLQVAVTDYKGVVVDGDS